MKLPNLKTLIFAFVLALVGFLLLHFVFSPLAVPSSVTFALGLFLGGVFTASIATSQSAPTNTEVKNQPLTTGATQSLYVGNLPYRANEYMVKELFEQYGNVVNVRLLKDKHTGKRRGFGFVEVAAQDAQTMIDKLNDCEFQQRTLKVREAKQKQDDE